MVQLARMLSKPTTAQAAWKAPVIILHGFLAYSRSWTTMSKRIADATNREVHALDLRNHGNSPHTDRFCFDELVGDLRSYIETQIQASSCIVIGHSYGGMVLCKYMQMNAKRLTAGIVVDITPMKISEQTVQEFCSYIVAMQQAIKNEARTVQEVEKFLSVHIKEKALRAFLLTNLVRRNESFSWLPNLQVLHDGLKSGSALWSPLDSFSTKPALFVFGESSRYYKDQHREKNISQIFASSSRSNVEQAVIARSNHLPHAENPDHFLQVVTEYMSRFP